MKKRMSSLTAIAVAVLFLTLSGCATLGLANPFSDAKGSYDDAMSAWDDGDYAAALSDVACAIAIDEKHYPSYRFLVRNYEQAMTKINAELTELTSGEPTVESVTREVEILYDLSWFVKYLDEGTDPRIISFRKNEVAIPMTDYSQQLTDARSEGYELALEKGRTLLEDGEIEEADKTLDLILDRFTEHKSEEQAEARTMLATMFADEAERIMRDISYEALESVDKLLSISDRYEESERVAEMQAELSGAAVDLLFAEADKASQAGTLEAYAEAIRIGRQAKDYVEDDDAITSRLYEYAQSAAEVADRKVRSVEADFDGTRESAQEVKAAYNTLAGWLAGWPDVEGFNDIVARYADFLENAKTRVYVVTDDNIAGSARQNMLSELQPLVTRQTDRYYWFHTPAEMEELEDIHLRVEDWKDIYGESSVYRLLYRDADDSYLDSLARLNTSSTREDLERLGIDYVIRVEAEPGELKTNQPSRFEEITYSGYLKTSGNIGTEKSTIAALRTAKGMGGDTLENYLSTENIERVWFDAPITLRYDRTVSTQEVTYTVTMERVSDGSEMYANRFTETITRSSREKLGTISSDAPASLPLIEYYREREYSGPESIPDSLPPTTGNFAQALANNFDADRMAMTLLRE